MKKRCLSMAWVDYCKAYDMIPRPWILKVLNLSKIAGNLEGFMRNSMILGKPTYPVAVKTSDQ